MLLARDAEVVGVEQEPEWVQRAGERARERGLADRVSFVEGVAERLPFADGSFDLVTCQTVLIHVRDAAAASWTIPAAFGGRRCARRRGRCYAALLIPTPPMS